MESATVKTICDTLADWAPLELAESWDNVGLLVGDSAREAKSVMTCLTLTSDVADEAIASNVDLIITHHPLPFRPVSRITCDSTEGSILWRLVGKRVAIYSAHTAFDSAASGINQQWAELLKLQDVKPLTANEDDPTIGTGRNGRLQDSTTLDAFAHLVGQAVAIADVRVVGAADASVSRVAFACGSGGSFLETAIEAGCDTLVTGEATFHTLLAARHAGVSVVLTGHYASERFAIESLASQLATEFPQINCWASRDERDPLRSLKVD